MSSLALVPFTFPVLKLPFVALQNVADCLNPFEIYHFSRISKKTKKIAKAFSRKDTRIFLISPCCVVIRFNSKVNWSFEPIIEPGPDSYTVYSDTYEPTRSHRDYEFFSKKPASEVLRVLEWVMDVFKNSKVYLNFNTRASSRQDLISYFNWCRVYPSEVPYVSLKCNHGTDIQFFLENYKKPTDMEHSRSDVRNGLVIKNGQFFYAKVRKQSHGWNILSLTLWGERRTVWVFNIEQLELPDNLETNLFKKVKIINYKPANLNLYNIFSSPVIDSVEHQLPDSYLNTFLKNWQAGLTNPNWKSVCISVPRQTNLINILDGITATYRDPRTVKRQVNVDKESFWIFGGIDIQKQDGTATATVQWKKYKVENEDSEVPNELIEEYERNQETGEVQHVEQELQGIVEQL